MRGEFISLFKRVATTTLKQVEGPGISIFTRCLRASGFSRHKHLPEGRSHSEATTDREGNEIYETSQGRGGLKGREDGQMERLQDRRRVAVSGIASRGGRRLFINTSWLLKEAFD